VTFAVRDHRRTGDGGLVDDRLAGELRPRRASAEIRKAKRRRDDRQTDWEPIHQESPQLENPKGVRHADEEANHAPAHTAIDDQPRSGYQVGGSAGMCRMRTGGGVGMPRDRMSLTSRAARKVHRLSLRFRERLAGLPIRAAHRGLPLPPSRLIYLVAGSND